MDGREDRYCVRMYAWKRRRSRKGESCCKAILFPFSFTLCRLLDPDDSKISMVVTFCAIAQSLFRGTFISNIPGFPLIFIDTVYVYEARRAKRIFCYVPFVQLKTK